MPDADRVPNVADGPSITYANAVGGTSTTLEGDQRPIHHVAAGMPRRTARSRGGRRDAISQVVAVHAIAHGHHVPQQAQQKRT
jgi:hypothetical protein